MNRVNYSGSVPVALANARITSRTIFFCSVGKRKNASKICRSKKGGQDKLRGSVRFARLQYLEDQTGATGTHWHTAPEAVRPEPVEG